MALSQVASTESADEVNELTAISVLLCDYLSLAPRTIGKGGGMIYLQARPLARGQVNWQRVDAADTVPFVELVQGAS